MGDNTNLPEPAKSIREAYAGNPILRGLAQLLPAGIGGAIDIWILFNVEQMREERAKVLFDELANGSLELTPEVVKSHDFLHRFVITAKAAMNTRAQEKIRLLAKHLKGTLLPNAPSEDEIEENVQILEEITLREWQALLICEEIFSEIPPRQTSFDLNKIADSWPKFSERLEFELGIADNEVSSFMNRIERTGLYTQITGAFWNYEGGQGYLTPRFFRLRAIIEAA